VVFIFLRDLRATLIPAVAVPVSLIGTFGAMYLFGFSLDNFSLMALTVATGFVVDDAIVVMENTTRHIESGMSRMKAALVGAGEVGFTVLSMSLSLVAVFGPLLLVGGLLGRLFHEFTVTLTVAILISLVVSLTTTPMMCARFLGLRDETKPRSWFFRMSEAAFERMRTGYERTLDWAVGHGLLMMGILAATIVLNIVLFVVIPKGFFPQQDTGQMRGTTRSDQATSFQSMRQKMIQVAKIIQDDPAVSTVVCNINSGGNGGFGPSGTTTASFNITLKPLKERKLSVDQVIARLRPRFFEVKGTQTFLQAVQDIQAGGRVASAQYQYTLTGDDLNELRTWSDKLRRELQKAPELTDVDSDQQPGGLEAEVVVDRDSAYRLGLTESQIDATLYDAFGQRLVSTIYNPLNQYHVVMEVAPQYWQNPEILRDIYVSTSGGAVSGTAATNAVAGTTILARGTTTLTAATIANDTARNAQLNALANTTRGGTSTAAAVSTAAEDMVPLSAFAHFGRGTTPTQVNHQGTFAATTISFNLPAGEPLSKATAAIDGAMRRIGMPASIHGEYAGTAKNFRQYQGQLPLMLVAALLAVYVVLGVLYESYIHPITILSTLPSAGIGALLALMATGNELTIIAFIGILLLIGIVKKNAIMMVDFALEAERSEGLDPRGAILKACALRFRPIMMTTLAAIFGALPLAIASGDGTEMRRPLGISIVGGLVVSQILTLYTTPVVYLYLERFRQWRKRKTGRKSQIPLHPRPAEAGA
jgi:multidrug efflux pump